MKRFARGSLRGTLAWIYLLATAIPLLLLTLFAIYHGRRQWAQQQLRLNDVAVQASHELDEQLAVRVGVVQLLARQLTLARLPITAEVAPWLDAVRGHAAGFTSLIVADSTGRVVASSPAGAAGSDVSDRPYFAELAAGSSWYVSDAFRGRVLGNRPISAVSAPLRDGQGRFVGIVEGSIQLERFGDMERRFHGIRGLRLVLVDGAKAIVYGGGDRRFESLAPLADTVLLKLRSGQPTVYRDPLDGRRWLVSAVAPGAGGWQVLAMQPVAVFVTELQRAILIIALAALWSVIVVLVGLRRVLSRAVLPVEQLAAEMREFDVTAAPRHLVLPSGTPAEIVELTHTFETMAERTRRVITGLVPICAQCKRIRDDEDSWQPIETFVRERSEAEFTHGLCPDCAHDLGFVPADPGA